MNRSMLSRPPIAPSKNALRVLRQLALGGSTIVGAVGGICGVAIISYDVHRRVRVVEQMLETRNTIRSIATGCGPSHIQRMFQAAENGEDFGVGVTQGKRRHKARKFSSHLAGQQQQAVAELLQDDDDALEAPHGSNELSRRQATAQRIKDATINITHAPSHTSFGRPSRRKHIKQTSRALPINLTGAERIMAATLEQHKVQGHAVNQRPCKPEHVAEKPLQGCVDEWLSSSRVSPEIESLQQETNNLQERLKAQQETFDAEELPEGMLDKTELGTLLSPRPRRPPSSSKDIALDTGFRPWPVAKSCSGIGASEQSLYCREASSHEEKHKQPHHTSDVVDFPRIMHGVDFENVQLAQLNPKSRLHPRLPEPDDMSLDEISDEFVPISVQKPMQKLQSTPVLSIPQHLDSTDLHYYTALPHMLVVPDRIGDREKDEMRPSKETEDASTKLSHAQQTVIKDRINKRIETDPRYRERVSSSGSAIYMKAVLHIHGAMASGQVEEGRKAWQEAVNMYAASGETIDFNLIDLLLEEFVYLFPVFVMSRPVRLFIQHLFAQDKHSPRAAEILFPTSKVRNVERAWGSTGRKVIARPLQERLAMMNAQRYLDHVWAADMNTENIVAELRNVIGAAKRRGMVLAETLFAPVLRFLWTMGDRARAQSVFDEMIYYHQVSPTFHTRAIMVRGYGLIGDWARVEKEIEKMHDDGISRLRPHGFALMFNTVFAHYATVKSVEQAHELLVHAISFWGLVPTSAVSTTAINCYLTHRRYDLVKEWVETVRVLFPRVDLETRNLAFRVGETWDKLKATCQDIEQACEAIAYKDKKPTFSGGFKAVASEAMARDLAAKLHAAQKACTPGRDEVDDEVQRSNNMDQYLERAYALSGPPSYLSQPEPIHTPEVRELKNQADSVARLKLRLQGKELEGYGSSNISWSSEHLVPQRMEHKPLPSKLALLYSSFPPDLLEHHLPSREAMLSQLSDYYEGRKANGLPTEHTIVKYVCEKLVKQSRYVDAAYILENVFNSPFVQGPKSDACVMFDLPTLELWLKVAHDLKSLRHYRNVLWAVLELCSELTTISTKFTLLASMTAEKICNGRFAVLTDDVQTEIWWLLARLKLKKKIQHGGMEMGFVNEPRVQLLKKRDVRSRSKNKSRGSGFGATIHI